MFCHQRESGKNSSGKVLLKKQEANVLKEKAKIHNKLMKTKFILKTLSSFDLKSKSQTSLI